MVNAKKRRFLSKESGTISIEFALSIPILFVLLMLFLELCRLISMCSIIDLSLAEAGRQSARTRISEQTYLQVFEQQLRNNRHSLYSIFVPTSADDVEVTITYCEDIQAIIDNNCDSDSSKKLAIYNVAYTYLPTFIFLPEAVLQQVAFKRSAVYVQEMAL